MFIRHLTTTSLYYLILRNVDVVNIYCIYKQYMLKLTFINHTSVDVKFCYILAPCNVTVCLTRHLPGAVVFCFQYSLHYDVTEYTYI